MVLMISYRIFGLGEGELSKVQDLEHSSLNFFFGKFGLTNFLGGGGGGGSQFPTPLYETLAG